MKSLRHSAGRHGNLPDKVVYLVSFLNPPDVQKRYADEAHADNVFGENPYRLPITWTGVLARSMWFGLLQSGIFFFIIIFFKFPDISGLHTKTL